MKKIITNFLFYTVMLVIILAAVFFCFYVIKAQKNMLKGGNTYNYDGLGVLGTWTNYSSSLIPRMKLILSEDKTYTFTMCNTLKGSYSLDQKQHEVIFANPSRIIQSEIPCEHDFSELENNISKNTWKYLITTGRAGYRMTGPLEMYITFNTGIPGEFNYIKMQK